MAKKFLLIGCIAFFALAQSWASIILIPMDASGQANHLKAYGVAFAAMQKDIKVDWLLNYRGGSYAFTANGDMEQLCKLRGVSFIRLSNKEYARIQKQINSPAFDGQIVKLEHAPRIAVYTPPNKQPWDDAVTLALTYAEIPFDKVYADEVLAGDLDKYDWLHLFHEDFTGQYGKFYGQFHQAQWYIDQQKTMETIAANHGFKKVSQMQLAVVKKIRDFVGSGGNLFAMCAATETFDIALAADGVDICEAEFDGDPADLNANSKLNFGNCFAFTDFKVSVSAWAYEHSSIDNRGRFVQQYYDNFKLVSAPGKLDAVPVMLCQNHTRTIPGFMGQTTAFRKNVIKPGVMVLADRLQATSTLTIQNGKVKDNLYEQDFEAHYLHGEYGKGSWTFLSGHDPEDYQHLVGNPPTDLKKFPNSPGYRLILNNVLFPSVKKHEVQTVVMSQAAKKEEAAPAAAPASGTIKLFPNPTADELVISITAGNIDEVFVYNIGGQEVIHYNGHTPSASLPMKDLAPGMYMVKVNGEYVGKVVKE